MLKKILLFSLILICGLPYVSKASHVSGGEVTYTSLGAGQYKVQLILYWDCASFDPGTTANMTATNTCGLASVPFIVNLDTAYEVSQVCATSLASTRCNGGTLPGNKKNVYSAIVTLPGACVQWTFEHYNCCRNVSVNVPSQPSYTFYATLNNQDAPNNNSPYFTSQPLPYMCNGQPVCYSPGVVETDGNTLTFSFVNAMDVNSTTPVPYAGGYSGASPMPGITIDPNTGLISFTPSTTGNFVVSFLVVEKNSSGVVIGSVIRDIQMVVVSCSNQVISCNAGAISSLTGFGATSTGPNSMQICENIPFSFNISFTDPDAANILTYTSNVLQVLPGATISSTGTNPITISIAWTAPAGSANTNTTFALTVADNACPVTGQQTVNYIIDVLSAANAGPDHIKCGNQAVQLNGNGPGTVFNWSVLSGPPMVVGTNFSCNPCQNPFASPTATTTYLLTCNGGSGCVITDTVTVNVVPDFNYNVTQSSANSCLMQPIQLGIANLLPAVSGYTYLWSPATYLSNPNIADPVATITTPGSYSYSVLVTNPDGCVKSDNVTITVIPAVSPTITAFADTSFCAGGSATLGLSFGSGVPAACGTSLTGTCMGAGSTVVFGTGSATNTSTSYPAPYGNYYKSVKHQFLFTASELLAAGMVAGKIDQLDFNITTVNGTTLYKNFKIDMGCTNLSSITTWQTGLVNVYTPKNFTIASGWNQHLFDNAYEWDGISNVIIEICSDNTSDANYTNNSQSSYSVTPFVSTIWYNTDASAACPSTFVNGTSSNRPNMRLHNCTIAANPANYSYSWTPSATVAAPTTQNTTGSPMATTTYTVTVTDLSGGCTATDSVLVDVLNLNTLTVTPAGPYCASNGIDTLEASVPVGSGVWTGNGIVNPALGVFNPAVAGVGTHEVIYTISGVCGTGADSMDIVVTGAPDATITQVANQCLSGSAITLTAVTPGGIWSGSGITNASSGTFSPSAAGVGYDTITYTVVSPCFAEDTMVISVSSQLDATITHTGPFCTADPALALSAVDAGGVWSGPGITNTAAGIFDPLVAGDGDHVIYYTISGLCGNVDTDTIKVIDSPNLMITSDKVEGCEPTTISFIGTHDQPGGSTWWTFGDPTSGVNDTSTSDTPTHQYNYSGTYTVTYMYANTIGCSDTVTMPAYVTIHSQPVAMFSSSPQPTTIVSPEVNFLDNSTGVIDMWHWTFGIMNDSSLLQNPSYTYPDTGAFPVELIVTNINGCADTANSVVVIDQIFVFYAPTAFTPNENGNNDVFRVYGDGIDRETFEMRIFNRWGETVYVGNKYEEGWNGARNNTGELVGADSYVYKVTFRDYSGKKHQYIGHVTIIK